LLLGVAIVKVARTHKSLILSFII